MRILFSLNPWRLKFWLDQNGNWRERRVDTTFTRSACWLRGSLLWGRVPFYGHPLQPRHSDGGVAFGSQQPKGRGSLCQQPGTGSPAIDPSMSKPRDLLPLGASHEYLYWQRSCVWSQGSAGRSPQHRGEVVEKRRPIDCTPSRAQARAQVCFGNRVPGHPVCGVVPRQGNKTTLPESSKKGCFYNFRKSSSVWFYFGGWTVFVPPLSLRSLRYFIKSVSMKLEVVLFSSRASLDSSPFKSS